MFRHRTTAVLHAVRVRGVAGLHHVARAIGASHDETEQELAAATENGLLRHRATGAMTGWSITAEGKAHHREAVAADLDEFEHRHALEATNAQFVALNEGFKVLCTRWQLEGHPPDCVDDLGTINDAITAAIRPLADVDSRFTHYITDFDAALTRVRDGDEKAFASPLCDSYHDIWMHLHQDLMASLCRDRSAEDGH